MCDSVPVEGGLAIRRLGGELGAGLEERLKDSTRALEVIVDDIDKEVCVHYLVNQLASRCVGVVELRPLTTELICFVLPRHEADSFNDSRLNDLLAREHSPCHSVWSIRVRVRPKIATPVDHIVRDVGIALNMW